MFWRFNRLGKSEKSFAGEGNRQAWKTTANLERKRETATPQGTCLSILRKKKMVFEKEKK